MSIKKYKNTYHGIFKWRQITWENGTNLFEWQVVHTIINNTCFLKYKQRNTHWM